MKRLVFIFVFLMLFGGVLAMNNPIRVKSFEGYSVKVFVWPSNYGPAVNSASGVVGEDGFFETTFFSLNEGNYWLQVSIFDLEGDKIRDFELKNMSVDRQISLDCTSSCFIFFEKVIREDVIINDNSGESVEKIVSGMTDVSEENESVVVVKEEEEDRGTLVYLTGKVVEVKESFGFWGYSIKGIVVLLLTIFGIFMLMRYGKNNENIVSEDDKELEYMEKKVKETESKIGKIKNEKMKKIRIEKTKEKLIKEEA